MSPAIFLKTILLVKKSTRPVWPWAVESATGTTNVTVAPTRFPAWAILGVNCAWFIGLFANCYQKLLLEYRALSVIHSSLCYSNHLVSFLLLLPFVSPVCLLFSFPVPRYLDNSWVFNLIWIIPTHVTHALISMKTIGLVRTVRESSMPKKTMLLDLWTRLQGSAM